MTIGETLTELFAAWRDGDALRAGAHFGLDAVYREMRHGPIRGRTAIVAHFTRFFRDGPRWRFHPEGATVEGDRATIRYRFELERRDGSWLERHGAAFARFANGTIVEWREEEEHMSAEALSIDVTSTGEPPVQLFTLSGSLDIATSPTLRAALMEAAGRDQHEFVVDLSALEFIDSTGLGALIGAHKRAGEQAGAVRLVAQEGQILRLLRITGLLDVFPVYPTVAAALSDGSRLVGL